MDGYVVIGTEIDTKQFDAQIQYIEKKMEEIEYKLKQADMGFEVGDTSKLEAEYERLGNQLTSLKTKQNEINSQGYDRLKNTINDISAGHSNVLRKITTWGLAIFGIRTAYTGIRQIMNGVLSQNEGLKNQMESLRNSLYAAFTPIVEKIVNLIRTLMAYINYLWKGLFGKDLFKSTSKSLANGAKSAKEINKQLAGFDEANVLSSNSSSGGSVGGGATDLKLSDVPIPGWLKWIRDFIEKHPKISKIIFGLAAFTLFGGWKLAGGIFGTITSLLGKKGAGAAATGASGLLGILGTMLLIGATVIICKVTYDQVVKAYKAYKDMKKAQKEANEVTQSSIQKDGEKERSILNETKALDKNDEQRQKNIEKVIKMIDIDDEYVHNTLEGRKTQKVAEEEYKKQLGLTVLAFQDLKNTSGLTEEEQYKYYKFLKNYLTPEQLANAEQLGLTAGEAEELRTTFMGLNTKFKTKYDVEMQPAKDAIQSFVDTTKKALSKPIEIRLQASFEAINDTLKRALKVAFHADGGIVNLPGRGVPVAHYAGEAGREGIIPMDNQEQMSLLGQEIAKYVNINNVVNNYMDARKINTLLQQSANKERLANNG